MLEKVYFISPTGIKRVFTFLFLILSFSSFAQYKGYLEINGSSNEMSAGLKGCLVTLYVDTAKNGTYVQQEQMVTPNNAKFKFKLRYNTVYLIECSKGGYTTKKVRFDTEIKESKLDSVSKFEFIVDMIPDKDGKKFVRPVANVFYHIKKSSFDYELDYTKEEQEEEERKERERLEKLEMARIAAEEKAALNEKAKKYQDAESKVAEEKIEKALQIAGNDKPAILNQFKQTMLQGQTFQDEKAEAMYEKYLSEKSKVASNPNEVIDYKSVVQAAKIVGEQLKQAQDKEIIEKEKEILAKKEAAAKTQEEVFKQQQLAVKSEMTTKLEMAAKLEEEKKAKAKEDFNKKVAESIVKGGGDKDLTIEALKQTFPKNDPYAQVKAEAIFEEYAKKTLAKGGVAKSDLDFGALFSAAEMAETKAIAEDDARTTFKNTQGVKEYQRKEAEKSNKTQQIAIDKITKAIKEANGDPNAILAGFESTFEKNDPFKKEKAKSMYVQYVNDLKRAQSSGGTAGTGIDFQSLFGAANKAQEDLENGDYVTPKIPELPGQKPVVSKEEQERIAKQQAMKEAQKKIEEVKAEEQRKVELEKRIRFEVAVKKGAENKTLIIREIANTLPPNADFKEERAAAMYENYLQQKAKLEKSGQVNSTIDVTSLFAAADAAVATQLENKYKNVMLEKEIAEDTRKKEEFKTRSQISSQEVDQQLIMAEEQKKSLKKLEEDSKAREDEIRRISQAQLKASEVERKAEEARIAAQIKQAQTQQVGKLETELAELNEERNKKKIQEIDAQQAELKKIREEEEKIKRLEQEREAKLQQAKSSTSELASAEAKRIAVEEANRKAKEEQQRIAAATLAQQEAKLKAEEEVKAKERARAEEIRKSNELAKMESDLRAKEEANLAEYIEKVKKDEVNREAIEKARIEKERAAQVASAEKARLEVQREAKAEQERRERAEAQRLALEAEKEKDAALREKKAQQARERDAAAIALAEQKQKIEAERRISEEVERLNKQASAQIAAEQKAKIEAERQAKETQERLEREASIRLAAEAKAARDAKEREEKLLASKQKEEAAQKLAAEKQRLAEEKRLKDEQERIARERAIQIAVEQKQREEQMERERLVAERKAKQEAEQAALLAKQKADEEAKRLAEEERLAKEAAVAKAKADLLAKMELERKQKLESEAIAKAELEAKLKLEAEQKAKADEEKRKKEAEARLAFAKEQAKQDSIRKASTAAYLAKSQQADKLSEEERKRKFEEAKINMERSKLSEKERREQFLSQLASIYPNGVTEENIQEKEFKLYRLIVNNQGQLNVYEKKTWNWGGVFYFKNGDITITATLFDLEVKKYKGN
ncbi:MAG: hypothetical protein K1X82_04015 [Bacteroidia bacterium]|nr:hypothetical protein [Bacteroidia bacterium]